MKKFKKLSALLMASVITTGTVSATASNAIWITSSKEYLIKKLESCDLYVPADSDIFSNTYLYSLGNYGYKVYDMEGYDDYLINPDRLTMTVTDGMDIEKFNALADEFFPGAVVNVTADDDSAGCLRIDISGYSDRQYTLKESIGKEITIEQARVFTDALGEFAEINSSSFDFYPVSPGIGYTGLTDYLNITPEKLEQIENYINANNIKCHIRIDDVFETDKYGSVISENITVLPDEELSITEHFELAEQFCRDLDIKPNWLCPSMSSAFDKTTIEMYSNIDGDANDDGELSLADAITIMQSVGNPDKYSLTPQGEFNADIAGDYDGITNMDALAVQRKLLHLE